MVAAEYYVLLALVVEAHALEYIALRPELGGDSELGLWRSLRCASSPPAWRNHMTSVVIWNFRYNPVPSGFLD